MFILVWHLKQQNHIYCNEAKDELLHIQSTAETSETLFVHEDSFTERNLFSSVSPRIKKEINYFMMQKEHGKIQALGQQHKEKSISYVTARATFQRETFFYLPSCAICPHQRIITRDYEYLHFLHQNMVLSSTTARNSCQTPHF